MNFGFLRNKIIILLLPTLFSCKMGDDFSRPKIIDQDSKFVNENKSENDNLTSTYWWKDIDDEVFNEYVEELLKSNLTLRQNYVKVLENYEKINISRGGLLPEISSNVNGSRNITPVNGIQGFDLGGGGNNKIYNTNFQAELAVSWQLDLFGKIRRSIEASEAEFEASIYDLEALKHSLIAQLLQTRISIASNLELVEMARNNSKDKKDIYDLMLRRYDSGVRNIDFSDVLLAKENYYKSLTEIDNYQKDLKADIYEFDVLLGRKAGETDIITEKFSLMKEPKDVPEILPAQLLDRRPDLRSSELRLKAQNANIGVAIADLYPDFSISGTVGYASDQTSTLINSDQIGSSLLGNITTKLFQGGRLRANVRLEKKRAEELSLKYSEDLLNAIKEVETGLNNDVSLTKILNNQTISLDSTKKREKIANFRYKRGIIDLKEYLEVKNQYYNDRKNWVLTLQQKWNNRIALYLALGGNWLEEQDTKFHF